MEPVEIILNALTPQKLNLGHTLWGSSMMTNQATLLKSLKIIKNHTTYQKKLIAITQTSQEFLNGPLEIILSALPP